MQFTLIVTIAAAATAYAVPLENSAETANGANVAVRTHEDLSLPTDCTASDLLKCVMQLSSIGGSCAATAVEGGIDVAAGLACVEASSSTAANIDECKSCIPETS